MCMTACTDFPCRNAQSTVTQPSAQLESLKMMSPLSKSYTEKMRTESPFTLLNIFTRDHQHHNVEDSSLS